MSETTTGTKTFTSIQVDYRTPLAAPFAAGAVKFKAQTVKNGRAQAVAYADARVMMDRLDEVFGPGGWSDEYELLANGSVVCKLSCLVAGAWVTKSDVGSQSKQAGEGDRLKAAYSDAFKRACVKWGVGRYLYALPKQWLDYDEQTRQFRQKPALPAAAPAAAHTATVVKLATLEALKARAKQAGVLTVEKWRAAQDRSKGDVNYLVEFLNNLLAEWQQEQAAAQADPDPGLFQPGDAYEGVVPRHVKERV